MMIHLTEDCLHACVLMHLTQVIVTCRTEYLSVKGAYQSLFAPVEGRGSSVSKQQLQELFVWPFQKDQRKKYFTQWVAERRTRGDLETLDQAGGQAGAAWSPEDYMQRISSVPGLEFLAQTPFALRVLADALPRLYAKPEPRVAVAAAHRAHTVSRPITRARVYAAFVEECWEEGERRRRRVPIPGLPVSFDGPTSYNNYCQDLAVSMLVRKQVCRSVAMSGRQGLSVRSFERSQLPITPSTHTTQT